ncbi:hypothetical protein FDG2_4181 [Candidatus Protofrankia californiensis]|uniref:Uncharacterized protein n=1 Tax=Candidatus Protofrankia californiensis TaxID=1839754 RepID=A0A1C3P469_9ACTN|nr:hypothetical protein FDG2_4181 [Candidatus Protofrankia californiensis]
MVDLRPASQPPFRSLRARLAGQPLDESLREEVPHYVKSALLGWLAELENADDDRKPPLAVRVSLRLGIQFLPGTASLTCFPYDTDLLNVIDAALQLRSVKATTYGDLLDYPEGSRGQHMRDLLQKLENILELGRIAFRVTTNGSCLEYRIDPTVASAAEHTLASAPPDASELLSQAWESAYALDPDPDTAYGNAVRAVEEVLCPLVLPNDKMPTLGKALRHLRDAPSKWTFVLLDKTGEGSIEPLEMILRRLWEGQHSRHGGGPTGFSPQTLEEARAAVHLAALAMQWISSGAFAPI